MIERVRRSVFVRNSMILFLGSMAVNFLNYLFHLVVGRMVSIEIYGEVESLISFLRIISVPALTLTAVATKYGAITKAGKDTAGARRILRTLNKSSLFWGVCALGLLFSLVPFVKDFLKIEGGWPLAIAGLAAFTWLFAFTGNGMLAGWQEFSRSNVANILGTIVKFLSVLVFLKLGFEVNGIMGSFLLEAIMTYIVLIFIFKRFFEKKNQVTEDKKAYISADLMKEYFMLAFVGTLTLNLLTNIDMVLAKNILNPNDAGVYGALTVMSKAIFFATGAIATVMFSMSAEESHQQKKTKKALKNSIILTTLLSILAIGGYFVFGEVVARIFFGEKYLGAAGLLGWFAVLAVLLSFVNLIVLYLLSIDHRRSIWSFLFLTLIGTVLILVFAETILGIMVMMSVLQVGIIVIGLFFVFVQENKQITREFFSRRAERSNV